MWCPYQHWAFAPLVVSKSGVPHADSLRFRLLRLFFVRASLFWLCSLVPGLYEVILPRLPPPTCSRPVSGVGLGLFLFCGFLAVAFRALLGPCFSLCNLRLFVIKRIFLSLFNTPSLSVRGYSIHPLSAP
jgi:hypothetical protein